MTNRITEAQLQAVCTRINRTLGTPLAPYAGSDPCPRAYLIDYSYGGVSLHQMSDSGTGESDVFGCGHVTKRALMDMMRAFLAGVDARAQS